MYSMDGSMGISFLIVPRTGNICLSLFGPVPIKDENDFFNNKPPVKLYEFYGGTRSITELVIF